MIKLGEQRWEQSIEEHGEQSGAVPKSPSVGSQLCGKRRTSSKAVPSISGAWPLIGGKHVFICWSTGEHPWTWLAPLVVQQNFSH